MALPAKDCDWIELARSFRAQPHAEMLTAATMAVAMMILVLMACLLGIQCRHGALPGWDPATATIVTRSFTASRSLSGTPSGHSTTPPGESAVLSNNVAFRLTHGRLVPRNSTFVAPIWSARSSMVDLQQIPRSRTTKPAGSTVSIEFSPARPAELGSPLVSTPRSLVTGGAGFLGSHLCDRLLLEGHEVICVDNLLTGRLENVRHLLAHPRFTFVRHDVSAPIELESLVPNAGGNGWRGNGARPRLDHVLHFASPASPKDYASHPIETLKCGAFGTYNALTLARETKSVFLLASTSEVYGDPEVSPQPESYWGRVNPMGPRSCYDEAKRYAEAMTFAFHRKHGVKVRVIRIFNTYGERMRLDDGRVLPNFLGQALRGEPLTVYGDGSQTRSFCYVSDLVEGIYRMLLSHETGPINLGNPEEIPDAALPRDRADQSGE